MLGRTRAQVEVLLGAASSPLPLSVLELNPIVVTDRFSFFGARPLPSLEEEWRDFFSPFSPFSDFLDLPLRGDLEDPFFFFSPSFLSFLSFFLRGDVLADPERWREEEEEEREGEAGKVETGEAVGGGGVEVLLGGEIGEGGSSCSDRVVRLSTVRAGDTAGPDPRRRAAGESAATGGEEERGGEGEVEGEGGTATPLARSFSVTVW